MDLVVRALIDPLAGDVVQLAAEAELEGYRHIRRLVDEWVAKTNRFDRSGEKLLGAWSDNVLVGIGGLTLELSRNDWLRMRRFYVSSAYRGKGVARMLAEGLLHHARKYTTVVTVHAGDEGAGLFWQAMGFQPLARESYTHILEFR